MTTKKREKKAAAVTEPAASTAPFFRLMSLELLQPNDYNARRFKENMTPPRQARFWELVSSVRDKGILEPLLVRLVPGDDVMFEVVAGERRYRAAKHVAEENGISAVEYMVPCMIHDLNADEAFDLMLVENLQREDLSPFETATAFRDYLDKHGNTADAVAELSARTGIPTHAIRRQVRIVTLPEPIRDAWREGKITQSHAEHFTRLDDEAQALELLEVCLRGKLTVRELAERIGALAVDLDKGFFDQSGCQLCAYNTSVQSGLFSDLTPAGKCGGPACFENNQSDFLTANWHKSKAHEKYGTNTFRFGHRLDVAAESIHQEPTERCLACDAFASIVRLTGAVVSGYERTCIGPRACFEELYCQPSPPVEEEPVGAQHAAPALDPALDSSDMSHQSHTSHPSDESPVDEDRDGKMIEKFEEFENLANTLAGIRDKKSETPASPPPPVEETAPVFNAQRGERVRKDFVRAQLLPMTGSEHSLNSLRLAILALTASAQGGVKQYICGLLDISANVKIDKIAVKIFELGPNEGFVLLHQIAATQIMGDFTLMPEVWQLVGKEFGINIARDWHLNKDYLTSLTKSEIVRVGEEVGIWKDEKVEDYRFAHHQGKALLALGKDDLIACILDSGADLEFRVPAEIIGKK